MTKLSWLMLGLLTALAPLAPPAARAADRVTVSAVPCKTVADCWLAADGQPAEALRVLDDAAREHDLPAEVLGRVAALAARPPARPGGPATAGSASL